jgi:hypothetical protein
MISRRRFPEEQRNFDESDSGNKADAVRLQHCALVNTLRASQSAHDIRC